MAKRCIRRMSTADIVSDLFPVIWRLLWIDVFYATPRTHDARRSDAATNWLGGRLAAACTAAVYFGVAANGVFGATRLLSVALILLH